MAETVGDLQTAALPLYVQRLGQLLNISPLLDNVEKVFATSDIKQTKRPSRRPATDLRLERSAASDARVYNFTLVTEERKWVQDLLLSDSEESDSDLSESEQVAMALELNYRKRKRWRKRLRTDPKLWKFRYFSSGLLMDTDHYPEHVKRIDKLIASGEAGRKVAKEIAEDRKREEERKKQVEHEREQYRLNLWSFIAKKEVPKMAKMYATARHNVTTNAKKIAQLCQREVKKMAQKSQRVSKEVSIQPRARRLMKEALMYWRRYEKTEKEQRRKAEREAVEQRKIDDEMREAKRQQRKLNFLITQTELYAHFMAKKLTGEEDASGDILKQLEDAPLQREVHPGIMVDLENPGDYNSEVMKAKALANVEAALLKQDATSKSFDRRKTSVSDPATSDLQESFDKEFSLATPVLYSDSEMPQPNMFRGKLKVYQLKGMNWLANLYDQGINGILADEMGLGKTVQSISLLAHLAERQGIWGPFLVVAPASTLHNWQQECSRFVPRLKVLPYWGSPHERKIIRKYWSPSLLFKENSPFHILITSYQLVVQDVKYFHRVKWQYMVLDEAQAIKSSSSMRWKVLLSFSCRNRLLLTGTPIQNTMQELWALLHFIMPTMFDSHEEFNEWFSRDIESHAEKKGGLDENQLSRLHMILKPFMLRRIKRDVEHEMAEKIEVHLSCDLSTRQRRLYDGLRQRISMEDLLQTSHSLSSQSQRESSLLNLVMQFRKVCNHPDLFERRDVVSPLSLAVPSPTLPRLLHHHHHHDYKHRHRTLTVVLGVHATDHIHRASLTDSLTPNEGVWSFLRLAGVCPREMATIMLSHFTDRLRVMMSLVSRAHILYRQRLWHSNTSTSRYHSTQLVLWPDQRVSFAAVYDSPVLQDMVFTGPSSSVYTHTIHRLFPLKTTSQTGAELTEISSMVSGEDRERSSPCSTPLSTPISHSNSPLATVTPPREREKKMGNGVRPNGLNDTFKSLSPCHPTTTSAAASSFSSSLSFPHLTPPPPSVGFKKDSSMTTLTQKKLFETSPGKMICGGTSTNDDMVAQNGHISNVLVDKEHVLVEEECPYNQRSNEPAKGREEEIAEENMKREEEEEDEEDQSATAGNGCKGERHLPCMPTHMPRFLLTHSPSVAVPLNPVYVCERVAEYQRQEWLRGGPDSLKHLLLHGTEEDRREEEKMWLGLYHSPPGGLHAVRPLDGWARIQIPGKENMIYDSGKMTVLDKLLAQLRREGHRVLIYSQMTRMIDLLEEFMAYRRYKYIRLDGSSRISDRRDMVDDFQTKSDIFVFLLSTRAGGLGINLTAADTVIFYDSDWNPTVDQQAMDRAHRLGQTKQVTVYRLVVKGSIEERILQRAREKSEIQKMVISGGDFKPDTLKTKEMVSLLLDDDEMKSRFLAKQAEKEQEQGRRSRGKKRKNLSANSSSEPLSKKPNVSASPSPLIFSSRPVSVMSVASSEVTMNGGDQVLDVIGGGGEEGPDGLVKNSPVGRGVKKERKNKTKTSAPLGGRGKFQKRKGGGGGSMSAAASAGAMAGALAASNAAFATLGYSLPSSYPSPSSSNHSLSVAPQASASSTHGSSTQSSPRASLSPAPSSSGGAWTQQTPPSSRLSTTVNRTLLAQSKNSS